MHILVTAGPTREYLDPVRFISNGSTGKMGYAIAKAAVRRGHKVTLISGPVSLPVPAGVKFVPVVSALEMFNAAKKVFPKTNAVIMSAAVGDYRPAKKSSRKIKKQHEDNHGLEIKMVPNPDIIAQLGRRKKGSQILVGFAMEDHLGHVHSLEKFSRKNLDCIVLNEPSAVGQDKNNVQVYTREWEWQTWPEMSKAAIGTKLIAMTEKLVSFQKIIK